MPFSSITINALYKLSKDEDDEFESLSKNPNCNTISETLMGKRIVWQVAKKSEEEEVSLRFKRTELLPQA